MDVNENQIKEDYLKNLDPEDFKAFKLEGLKAEEKGNNYDFWFACLHKFFTSGKWSGSRLLELGSGPTVHNVATASAHVPYIVLSELVEGNCEAARKWLRNEPGCMDWTAFLKRIAMAEGRTDAKAACLEIASRIRSAVKAVVHCNVLDDQMIPKEYTQEPYDIIVTALTFETAAVNFESYSKILQRTNRLLRSGGKLLMIGVIMCSHWDVGGNKFHCLQLQEKDIQAALEANGFGDIEWKVKQDLVDGLPFDGNKVYFLSCTKI